MYGGIRTTPEDAYGVHSQGLCSPYYVGVNAILLPIIPYTLATALHDTHIRLALILGTAFSGGIIIFGVLCRFTGGYRTWPFVLELLMLAVNAVMLGMSYEEEDDVIRYHNFITNSVYAAFGVLSVMFSIPFTLQYVQEFVPPSSSTHDKVIRAAYVTTATWTAAFVTNTLLYLVPICKGRDWEHSHALNLVFRIILPVFVALFAAIFCRIWPLRVLQHLRGSVGFDATARKLVVNPLAMPDGMFMAGGPIQIHAFAV